MRGDTHGDQKRGTMHVAVYHHSGITVVTQHATERAIERERERNREREGRGVGFHAGRMSGPGVLISIRCA